jgi:enamine deaminase RidA (YjgF/YER057c/UK114 family)
MKRTAYQPPNVFAPAGKTYSHGIIVEAGRTLYVAGQTSRDSQRNVV